MPPSTASRGAHARRQTDRVRIRGLGWVGGLPRLLGHRAHPAQSQLCSCSLGGGDLLTSEALSPCSHGMSVDGHTNPLLSKTHLSSSLVGRAPHRAIVQRRLCDRTFGLCLHASGDRELIPLRPSGSGSAVPEHQSKVSSSVTSAPGPPKLSLQVTLRIQSGSQQQAPVPHVSSGDCPPPTSALSPWSLDSTETEEQRGRWPRVLNSGSFLTTLNPHF